MTALKAALDAAEVALAGDVQGHVSRAHREAIWSALGAADDEGRRARARLAIDSTRPALSIWERLWPSNRLPHQLLDLAEQVSRGDLDGATLAEFRDQSETDLDDISWATVDKSTVGAGYAAHRALGVAIRDELFDPAQSNSTDRDEDLSPEKRDSAYLASVAVAGGAPWQPESSAEKRRDYWSWWLREAVPAVAGMR